MRAKEEKLDATGEVYKLGVLIHRVVVSHLLMRGTDIRMC